MKLKSAQAPHREALNSRPYVVGAEAQTTEPPIRPSIRVFWSLAKALW